mgnify:CR=1 FL=1
MKITKVEFYGDERGNFLRYSTIEIDHAVVIRGLRLIRRPDTTIMISMPRRKRIDDTYEDVAHPANATARRVIEEAVLNAWKKHE